MYICPICKGKLVKDNKSYYCDSRHCYDISKEGYVNLLPVQKKNSLNPGDNKEMISARHTYLNAGAYDRLIKAMVECMVKYVPTPNISILDAGCGEGYYLEKSKAYLEEYGRHATLCGVDISKDAVKIGAKSYKDIDFAVGSVYDMPYESGSFDIVLNVFAPFDNKEVCRVLKSDGVVLKVVPSKTHLKEFRQILYEEVTEHEEKSIDVSNMTLLDRVNVNYTKDFDNNEIISSLFKMTPYYFNADEKAKDTIMNMESITLTIDFDIYVYRVVEK